MIAVRYYRVSYSGTCLESMVKSHQAGYWVDTYTITL